MLDLLVGEFFFLSLLLFFFTFSGVFCLVSLAGQPFWPCLANL